MWIKLERANPESIRINCSSHDQMPKKGLLKKMEPSLKLLQEIQELD
jgi:hypothetical protein